MVQSQLIVIRCISSKNWWRASALKPAPLARITCFETLLIRKVTADNYCLLWA